METFNDQSKKPYSVERFATHPEVVKTREATESAIANFVHDLSERVHPAINQGIVFETFSTQSLTQIRNPRLFQVAGAISGARIGDTGDFSTYQEVLGSMIPVRGTALEVQLARAKKTNRNNPANFVATSAINPEQKVLGFPIENPHHDGIIGMAQVAISLDTAASLAAIDASRSTNYTRLGFTKAKLLWQDYSETIGEQIDELHSLHEQLHTDEPYFSSLELHTPKVAPNSIALTFDLSNSTERALAKNDGAFIHFLNSWKRNVEKIIAYHDLTDKTELIGDLGDGYSVIFWLNEETDVYDEEEIEAFRDLVVDPFNRNVQAMSEELADKYRDELGPLNFRSAETPTFSQINTPTDLSAQGLWENSRKLK